jgi:hypothetical protein
MIKEISKSDIVVRPFRVYKEWSLTESDIQPIFGKNITGSLFDSDTDETTSNGIYKRLVYSSIKSQFYTNSETSSILTEVGRRISYASDYERNLENEFALISIPQIQYGEGIKVGSVSLITNGSVYEDDGFSNLVSESIVYGNIFYDRGFVILTKNVVSGSTLTEYNLEFKSTKTIYENEIFITVLDGEFNVSQNPTAFSVMSGSIKNTVVNIPGKTDLYTASYYDLEYAKLNPQFWEFEYSSSIDPTGSYLSPYITTIGLYDDNLDMIAVAKLPQPIKSYPDYPLNFIIRFDT